MPKIIRDASGKFVRTTDEADQAKQATYADRPSYTPQELEAALEAMAPKVLPKAPQPLMPRSPSGDRALPKDGEVNNSAAISSRSVAPERPVKKVIVVYALRPSEVLDVFFAVVTLLFVSFCSAAVGMFLLDLLLTQMPDIIDTLVQKVLGQ